MSKRSMVCFIVLFIGALVLLGCGEADNAGTAIATATNGTSKTASAPTQKPVQHFKPGQTIKIGDTWQVKINSATTNQGDQVFQPKSGNVYLVIDVSMTNISSQEQTASSLLMWKLRDATGQAYTEAITSNTAPDGKVEANSPIRGTLTYEVPASMKSFTLAFEADIVSSGQTIWDINV